MSEDRNWNPENCRRCGHNDQVVKVRLLYGLPLKEAHPLNRFCKRCLYVFNKETGLGRFIEDDKVPSSVYTKCKVCGHIQYLMDDGDYYPTKCEVCGEENELFGVGLELNPT